MTQEGFFPNKISPSSTILDYKAVDQSHFYDDSQSELAFNNSRSTKKLIVQ